MPTLTRTLLHSTSSDFEVRSQSFSRLRTWRMGDFKVRTNVHLDGSYKSQSRIVAELWDGSKWNVVTSIMGTDPTLPDFSGYSKSDQKEADLVKIENRLLGEVASVIL